MVLERPDDARVEKLLAVLDISRQLAAPVALQTLLEAVERAALQVLGCERASVFLHDRRTDELVSLVATGGHEVRFSAERGLAGEVFRTGTMINLADAPADPRFHAEVDRTTGYHTRSLLTCPLYSGDRSPLGVLQVLNKRDGVFDAWDEVMATTFSAQVGVAIQRQLLLDGFAQKLRYERDLDVARQIQQDLLPRRAPRIDGYDIAGWNRPADATGGDFYDFHGLPDGAWSVTVGDVTGHGIGPALLAAECRALMRASALQTEDLSRLAGQVNALLCDDLTEGRFVTAFLGRLRPAEQRLTILSAGHGPIFSYRAATGEVRDLPPHGLPLGIVADYAYERQDEIILAAGDFLAVFTDGFSEWPTATGNRFGAERLRDLLRRDHALPAAEIVRRAYDAVLAFAGDEPQHDDLTAVLVKRV